MYMIQQGKSSATQMPTEKFCDELVGSMALSFSGTKPTKPEIFIAIVFCDYIVKELAPNIKNLY